MSRATFAANIAALREHFPEFADRMSAAATDPRLQFDIARNGRRIAVAQLDGDTKGLNSRYDPDRESARRLAGTEGSATLVLFGAGALIDARRALAERPGQAVIVAELSPTTWRSIAETIDLVPMIRTGRFEPVDSPESLQAAIYRTHYPSIADGIAVRWLGPWTDIEAHRDRFSQLGEVIHSASQELAADLSGYRRFGLRWLHHLVRNSFHPIAGDGLAELRSRLWDRPVNVVGAGPSAESILTTTPRDPIVAVDTVVPMLRRAGIAASAAVSIDAHAWSALHFRRPLQNKTILVADAGVSPRLTADASWIPVVGTHPLALLLAAAGAPLLSLGVPYTTVTEAAVIVAQAAGAREITIIGVDLGYPRAKSYARGTYHYDLFTRQAQRIFSNEAQFGAFVYGRELQTRGNFFELPGARSARERITYLATDTVLRNRLRRATVYPEDGATARTRVRAFWIDHLARIDTAIERVDSTIKASTPELLRLIGPHGLAHLPAHESLKNASEPSPAQALARSFRQIRALVSGIINRYC